MTPIEFKKEKKQVEEDVVALLKETESDFTLDHVKEVIYNEEDSDDYQHVVAMFDRGGDAIELQDILDTVTEAWNYFPHKALGGLSPQEKLVECEQKIPNNIES